MPSRKLSIWVNRTRTENVLSILTNSIRAIAKELQKILGNDKMSLI